MDGTFDVLGRVTSNPATDHTMKRRGRIAAWSIFAVGGVWVLLSPKGALAQQEQAVLSGVQYLRAHSTHLQAGESAMIALALIKAEVPANDPALTVLVDKIRSRFSTEGFAPERLTGHGIYEAAACSLALASLDAVGNLEYLRMLANYLLSQ
jgi:hypothetical protein